MPTLTPDEIRAASRKLSAADFAGTIRSYYPYWDAQYRPYLLMALDALPVEHFDFKPRPAMLTAHQHILHIAEAERAWIHATVEGNADEEWVSELPDVSQGWKTVIDAPDHAALRAMLDTWHRPTQMWLDRPPSELGRISKRTLPDGSVRQYTLHWILDHVQEHEIHHRAQLNMYLRMLGITPPSI
jgi:uncharacterized damage-inducible protein DinB